MALIHEVCPACSAPVDIPEGATRLSCPFCSSTLSIEPKGDNVALATATLVSSIATSGSRTQDAINEGAYVTQAELRRLQLGQELAMSQMRLSNVQSEIRTIERLQPTGVTRNQLNQLRTSEAELQEQIAKLNATLNPASAVVITPTHEPKGDSRQGLKWLLFSFYGRTTRRGYWLGIAIALIPFIFAISLTSANTSAAGSEPNRLASCFGSIVALLFIWVAAAVSTKRYQDLGLTGWWDAIKLIPVIGPLIQLIHLGFFPGNPTPNRYS